MGRCHAQAFRMAPVVFDLGLSPRLEFLADRDEQLAAEAARTLGFARASGDWRELVTDPLVDLVDITTPNSLHKDMALAAIGAGKAVYCEKPLAPNLEEARELAKAAREAGVSTFVGFNYLRDPVVALARELIESGELGEIWSFRGIHAEDYMRDPDTPWSWRLDPQSGDGVLSDLGSHIISMARFLIGDIGEVSADLKTVVANRPIRPAASERKLVEACDEARALVRFKNGAAGVIEASWVASGRKLHLAFEIYGSGGALRIDMERLNELQLFTTRDPAGREGFRRILAGPSHQNYAAFCPAPGHQLGFNDMKTIEAKDVLQSFASGRPFYPDFNEAARIQAVVSAIVQSAERRQWISVEALD